jgi:SAM-dependent methyltransferase
MPRVLPSSIAVNPGVGPRRHPAFRIRPWPWPLPALATWLAAWAVFAAVQGPAGWPIAALPAALVTAVTGALCVQGRWRRLIAAGGFPLSAVLGGVGGLGDAHASWIWLAALVPLALLYPARTWRDAPLFPTPAAALEGLDRWVTPAPRRVLDAGCGLGHGLDALHRLWPEASLEGIEWSRPLARVCRWRCRFAAVRRADMWQADWSRQDLVYLFQRPESMARAFAKARAELAPGGWLVSLEFAVPGERPWARLEAPGRRSLWVYRVGRHSTGCATGR